VCAGWFKAEPPVQKGEAWMLVKCYNGQIAHWQVIVADDHNHNHNHDIHHNCSTLGTLGMVGLTLFDKWGDVLGVQAGAFQMSGPATGLTTLPRFPSWIGLGVLLNV
jgi:hypothetical protein